MFFVVAILIMTSVYVSLNKRLSDKSRTGYFVVLAILGVLTILNTFIF